MSPWQTNGKKASELISHQTHSRRRKASTILLVASVTILVGVEVFGIAVATAWALGGLFELGAIVTFGIGTIFVLLGLTVMIPLVRQTWRIEAAGIDDQKAADAESQGLS